MTHGSKPLYSDNVNCIGKDAGGTLPSHGTRRALWHILSGAAALFLLGTTPLPAQQPASAGIRLLAFERAGAETEVTVMAPGKGKPLCDKPLALPTQQLSARAVVASRSLIFTAPDNPLRVLARIDLPATGKDFLLVFHPAPSTGTPYRIDVVPVPDGSFGSGDTAFLNYCGNTIGCVIAGEKLVVANGRSAIYQGSKPGTKAGNRTIACFRQNGTAWDERPFYSSRMIVQDGVRNLVLIIRNPSTGEPDFRGIADFVE